MKRNIWNCPCLGIRGYQGGELENFAGDTAVEAPVIIEERGSHGDLRLRIPAAYQGRLRIAYRGKRPVQSGRCDFSGDSSRDTSENIIRAFERRIPEERLTDRRLMKEKNGKGEANEE